MIDTIKIRLPLKDGPYKNDDEFYPTPLREIMYFSSQTHIATIFNPGKKLANNTKYTPTYIGEKILANNGLGAGYYLGVEVSLPKLMFGNNVEELSPGKDSLKSIVSALRKAINRDVGLKYTEEEILSSGVAKLHIGKNFQFDDPGAPTVIVNAIRKSRADRICDNNETKYENNGYSFRFHTNKRETIYYDKKSDLLQSLKSPKRAIDNTTTDDIREEDSPIHELLSDNFSGVLRLEVRLNDRKHIRKAFPPISDDLSFKNVFLNANIMQCLQEEWQKTTNNVSMIQLGRNDVLSIFEAIAADRFSNNYSLRDSLAIAAAADIINAMSLDYLRRLVEKYYGKTEWNRLKKKLINPESRHSSYFKKVEKELQEYHPIRL